MDAEEFRKRGKEMVDYIADYLINIRTRRVLPNVKPGYMRPMIAEEAPAQGEPWEKIFNDIERVIMPGVCIYYFLRHKVSLSSSYYYRRLHIGNHLICMHIFQH